MNLPGPLRLTRSAPLVPPLSLLAAGLGLLAGLVGCGKQAGPGKASPPPAPVHVAAARTINAPVDIRAIGLVTAYSTVHVYPQIDGLLKQVHFEQGQKVDANQELFTIDARPFQAALDQASAALDRDKAQMELNRRDLQRAKSSFAQGAATQEEVDQAETTLKASAATVELDRAAVETARIKLGYCSIRSPIEGVAGSLAVHAGNVVKSLTTDLVTINKVQPIYVVFSVPQKHLPAIQRYRKLGPLAVRAASPFGGISPEPGTLTFVDNSVAASTGTIKLWATFPNAHEQLWPGQFVNVTLTLTTQRGAVVVPSQAIQRGQQGQFIYVVDANDTVRAQPIRVNRTLNAADTVVASGIAPGDVLVTDGQLRLTPGARVQIMPGPATAPASAPATGPSSVPVTTPIGPRDQGAASGHSRSPARPNQEPGQ